MESASGFWYCCYPLCQSYEITDASGINHQLIWLTVFGRAWTALSGLLWALTFECSVWTTESQHTLDCKRPGDHLIQPLTQSKVFHYRLFFWSVSLLSLNSLVFIVDFSKGFFGGRIVWGFLFCFCLLAFFSVFPRVHFRKYEIQ